MPAKVIWLLAVATLLGAGWAASSMVIGGDRRPLLVGETTDAHHQIELACETCHAAPAFASVAKAEKALNRTCRKCHDKELKAGDDSHPRKKFRNPRMAAYWEKLDGRLCTSCHVEHRPEITRAGAVTVAMDFCAACHSEGEQDVRAARPSHAGLGFETCATAGCHNYHDNRALYEDFLVKHADTPWLAAEPVHSLTARHREWKKPPRSALARGDAVAPEAGLADAAALADWAGSGHAAAGVNCGACHAKAAGRDALPAAIEANWIDAPPLSVCEDCHKPQARTLALGRHGMRRHPRLAGPRNPARGLRQLGLDGWVPGAVAAWLADAPPPWTMTVAEARIPMRNDAAHRALDCGTCHLPHSVDIARAAADACASCHDDLHTRAWFESPHRALWQAELDGEAPPGSGVSCATCHMPRTGRRGRIATNHNQNDNLRPNEKMIRSVCLDCHGLGFALDALADPELVARNFRGRPQIRVESIDWAVKRARTDGKKTGG